MGEQTITRLDLQNRILNYFGQNSQYFTIDDLNASIQDGLDEVCAFTGVIYKAAVLDFIPGKTYYDFLTLLPDYIGIVAIFNRVTRRWMWPTSIKKLDQVRVDWETAYGTPWYFIPISHRYVSIYKKPISPYGQFTIFYIASAPAITDDTSIPLPEDHITSTLEEYSVTDLWEQMQEFRKAGENLSIYKTAVEDLRVWIKNRRNGERIPSLK